MRRRFFLIVFSILLSSILIVSVLQHFFYESERMRWIDQRLETVASSLIASGLSMDLIQNLDSTDDLISDLLGEERVDHIINIYSEEGKILAQNVTASELSMPFSPNEQWATYEVSDRLVRTLNLHKGNLIIQVGDILNESLKRWSVLNQRFAFFVSAVFLMLLGIAYFSSHILFSPLKKLTLELTSMSSRLDSRLGQSMSGFTVGPEFKRLSRPGAANRDEFEMLCAGIETFVKKLEDYTKSFHAQTAILTHELKTPLTILRNQLQILKGRGDTGLELTEALQEVDHLARMISNFLQWSVLTSNPGSPELYAIKLADVTRATVARLNSTHQNRIQVEGYTDLTIFALPDHVNQLLTNLLLNALNYSPEDKEVICQLNDTGVCVEDSGPGIPSIVLQHLGSPFNRGPSAPKNNRGSGLGLAWVNSLCQKYKWRLNIKSENTGTRICVSMT